MSKDKKITGVSGTFTTDSTVQILPNDNIGWICPVCGRGISPLVKTCPCKENEIHQGDFPYPPNPCPTWWPQVPMFTDNWWWKQPKITTVTYRVTTKGSKDD